MGFWYHSSRDWSKFTRYPGWVMVILSQEKYSPFPFFAPKTLFASQKSYLPPLTNHRVLLQKSPPPFYRQTTIKTFFKMEFPKHLKAFKEKRKQKLEGPCSMKALRNCAGKSNAISERKISSWFWHFSRFHWLWNFFDWMTEWLLDWFD